MLVAVQCRGFSRDPRDSNSGSPDCQPRSSGGAFFCVVPLMSCDAAITTAIGERHTIDCCRALAQAEGRYRQRPVSQRLRRVAVIDMPCMTSPIVSEAWAEGLTSWHR